VKGIVNDIEDLQEIWDTLNTCFDQPEKYIMEALDPIVKFKKNRAFHNRAVRGVLLVADISLAGGQESEAPSLPCQLSNTCPAYWLGCQWVTGNSGPRRGLRGLVAQWRTLFGPS
jgi:hypothetical protein